MYHLNEGDSPLVSVGFVVGYFSSAYECGGHMI